MNRRNINLSTLIIVMVLAIPGAALAQQTYSEDFTTTAYKDVILTSADWDTAAGELKLPTLPSFAGSYDTPGFARGVAVAGDFAFVADHGSGLSVIDISDPNNPVFVDNITLLSNAYDVVVEGDLAFVAYGGAGLKIFDISNPSNLSSEGEYDTPNNAVDVAVSGDLAFVADISGGLQIINISNPSSPVFAGSYNTSAYPSGVAVAGNNAFVADGAGLQVIDISDPSTPTLIGSYTTSGGVDVVVEGDLAFMADGWDGLLVIDISDPSNPVLAGSYNTPGFTREVVVSGNLAFVADDYGSGLQLIDISDPSTPVLFDSCDLPGSAYGVTVAGEHAFVADGGNGLHAVRVRNPIDPALVGSYDTPGIPYEIAVAGNHAFLADGTSMQVIDITDPANPTFAGSALPQSSTRDVVVAGDYAFTAEGSAGLQVLDISDPTNPTFASDFNLPGYSHGVAVAGDYAFLADDINGLDVVDISDPTLTAYAGNYNTPGNSYAVAIAGDLAFVADYYSGLLVLDISDPANPALAGSYDTPGRAVDVTIEGDYAFVADYYNGLQVIDISDPTNPALVGNYDTPNATEDVTIAGDHAFVTDWTSGLLVLDITDPTNPVLTGGYDTPTTAWAVAISGDHAFVTDEFNGLHILEVYDHVGIATSGNGQSIAVDGASDVIPRARLTSTETSGISWDLSADAGAGWTAFTPDNVWARITVPGNDLVWRTTHTYAGAGNPTVSDLNVDWLNEFGPITSISDVPNDQGGWVRLNFIRSGYDFADETTSPVTQYGIYRRVDNAALIAAVESRSSVPVDNENMGYTPPPGIETVWIDGTHYVRNLFATAGTFPPGTWALLTSVPATQSDSYLAEVTTQTDSSSAGTNYSVYVVTTHTTTPSVWFISAVDSGYSVDNIAPGVPLNLIAAYNTGSGNQLSWDPAPEEDFQYYRIYRDTDPNFVPSPGNFVEGTISTAWADPSFDGGGVYYKITSVDDADNESDPAAPGTVTAVPGPATPTVFALHQNHPNPFNPTTSIPFDVPAVGGEVTLRVFDVSGRLVKTLVDGAQTAGQKSVTWNGRSNSGHTVASGVYFYRLTAPGLEQTRTMVLLK